MRSLVGALGIVGFLGGLQPPAALATMISFEPASQTVTGSAAVQVVISDLLTTVGGFDIIVGIDPTILSPTGVEFGPFLGDSALGEATSTFTLVPMGINFTSLSFLTALELDPLQPASFALATLFFNTFAEGTSPLTFVQADAVNALAQPIALTTLDGSVTKVIPEPGTLALLTIGLGLGALRRRQHSQRRATATSSRTA
jgi:hypothetical protein